MSDRNCGILDFANCSLNLCVRCVINGRGSFVHKKYFRILQERACETEQLALALREIRPAFWHRTVEVEEDVFIFLENVGGWWVSFSAIQVILQLGRVGRQGFGSCGSPGLRWCWCLTLWANELDAPKGSEDFLVSEEIEGIEVTADCAGKEGRI